MKSIPALTLIFLSLAPGLSSATPLIADHFIRTGQQESLTAPWTVFGGATTTQQWSGLIEVIASGSGVNVPSSGFHEDAFYPFVPDNPSVPSTGGLPPSGLHLSFTGCAAAAECGAPRIESFFTFVDGVGPVTPPETTIAAFLSTIPYSQEHNYHFVIDIGSTAHLLTLGHGDGGVSDNSGQFDIQLFAISPRISEPPFPRTAATCQKTIGETTRNLASAVQKQHSLCLNAEAAGRTCNVSVRDAAIAKAIASAQRQITNHCNLPALNELGFGGTLLEIRDRLIQSAIDSAEELIRATYHSDYANKP